MPCYQRGKLVWEVLEKSVMRRFAIALLLIAGIEPLGAATLERLSLDDMIEQATSIVRGRIAGSWTAPAGNVIYTHYRMQVAERWKGPQRTEVEFVVPGGAYNGVRQVCSGAPQLIEGQEYVLFLWTSRSTGRTQIIGFTQGVFTVPAGSAETAVRTPSSELMFERGTGRIVQDERIEMRMRDLSSRITLRLAGGKGARQ